MVENQAKLASALLGGYLLGRTKKGGFALRLASRMFLSGQNTDPQELVRDNLNRLLASGVVDQLRAQAVEAAKAAVDARLQGLAANLNQRTENLRSQAEGAQQATDKASGTVAGLVSEPGGEEEQESEEQESEEGEGEESEDESSTDETEEEDSSAEDEDEAEPDEESDAAEDDGIEERAKELRRKRVATLEKMAADLNLDEDDVKDCSKPELARWIAEVEAEEATK